MKVECRKSSAEADSVSAKSEPHAVRCLGLFLCLLSGPIAHKKARLVSGCFVVNFMPRR